MNTDSTRQLGDTGNREFHFLTSRHNQVTKLINNDYDIRHKFMSLLRIQATVDKLFIIFFNVTHMRHFQQIIACIHFHANRIQGLHNLRYVCNNRFTTIGKLGKEMIFNNRIDTEFHFFRIDQNKFQFGRMFLI